MLKQAAQITKKARAYRPPVLTWIFSYNRKLMAKDISAGFTVFILLIPQGLAYALLAGMPPIFGLYAAGVPLLVYTVFGTSRELAVGPMAIASLLSGATISAVEGEDGGLLEEESDEWVEASLALALLTGILLLLLALLGMGGQITKCLSGSMLSGFTTGVACVIFLSQLPKLLGLSLNRQPYSHQTIRAIVTNLGHVNVPALLIGVSTAIALQTVKSWRQRYKRPDTSTAPTRSTIALSYCYEASRYSLLVAGLVTTLLSWALHNYSTYSLPVIGSVPRGLPTPALPSFSSPLLLQLLPGAAMIAIISFAGNWAVAKKFAEKNNYTVIASSEMIAYGLCNLVGSFFQSYVVAGGFARSAVNAEGGAQTPLAGLISGICILISLQFFTSLFYYLPLATLGAIIVVSVVSMMDFQKIFFAYRKGFYQDFVIILGSLLSTFWLGVAVGLMCGIALSVGRLVYSTSSAEFSTVTVTVDTGAKDSFGGGGGDDDGGDAKEKEKKCGGDDVNNFHLPDINEETSPLPSGSFRILQMSSLLYFGNLDNFKDSVQEASRSLVQALRGEAVISPSLTQTTSATTTAAATAATCVFGAIVVDAASWGHYLELPSASALDELRIALLAPKPLHVYVPPPSPSPSSTPSASPSLSPSSLPLSSVESSHSDATIVVKLGLVNCHPSVLKMLAALGTVEKIGVDMIFSSTEDCLRNCDYRLQLMMHNLREDDEEEEKHDSKESNDEDNTNSPTRRHHDSMLDDDNVDENIALMNMPPPPPPSTTTNNITYMKIPSPTEESIATVIYDHPEENI